MHNFELEEANTQYEIIEALCLSIKATACEAFDVQKHQVHIF